MIDFLEADEKPNARLMVQRLSEDGKCLLTGVTEDLTYLPVDTNPDNILSNNMACVMRDLAKSMLYTVYYSTGIKGFDVTFCSPPEFQEYNLKIVELAENEVSPEASEALKLEGYDLTKIYEFLTARHAKGIARIAAPDKNGTHMDAQQYLGFVMRSRIKARASAIIKPPALVSV
jgi:hypothetical protein